MIPLYFQCLDCEAVHRDGKLSYEPSPRDLLTLLGSCPDCGGKVEEVTDRALITDAQDEDDFHADNAQEPGFYRRAS